MLDLHLFMKVFEIYKLLLVVWNFYAPTYYSHLHLFAFPLVFSYFMWLSAIKLISLI